MDLSRVPVAELRAGFDALRSPSARRRWLAALRGDRRGGARRLAETLARRLEAERAEARRLARLFGRQRRLHAAGAARVAGVDEVGVGPMAGPVVAAAVVLPVDVRPAGLDDSKRLTRVARERLAAEIRECAVDLAVAEVATDEVDRLNVYRASLEAMRRAVAALAREPDHLLVDARSVPKVAMPQTPIVGGDGSEACIAAASIVAKVHRDALMRRYDRRYPGYGFARHMGYCTREHLLALERLGPSALHRRRFAPVAQLRLL